ncbi:hypothetical protein DMH03_09030 [Amycolatopsis sp. WAC 01376]|nr:hypothetical protein DMH03_09030 [Amycolatopsis sp. WAC 01376]
MGPLYVLCTQGKELTSRRTLLAIDLAGKVLWRRELEGDPKGHWSQKSYTKHLRVSESGTVFLIDGDVLLGFDESGGTQAEIRLDHDPDEAPGSFALVRGGFCTTWTTLPGRHRDVRVDVRDGSGACTWSTRIPTEPLGFASSEPTMPHEFSPSYWDPLLVSDDRILAAFDDLGRGLSLSYLLDRDSGRLVATTPVSGGMHKAIAGPSEFLAGDRGFGLLGTARYDASGAEVVRWDSEGPFLVGPDGVIRCAESGNPERHRRFRKLNADGSTEDGPVLSRRHFGSPALDSAGTAVFTQDGALRAIDAELHERVLCEIPEERDLYGRVLLLEDGLVAFTVGHELFLAATDLGPVPSSGWVCGDGNLRANPVLEKP